MAKKVGKKKSAAKPAASKKAMPISNKKKKGC